MRQPESSRWPSESTRSEGWGESQDELYNLESRETVGSQDFGRNSSHPARQASDGVKAQGTPGKNGRTGHTSIRGTLRC